LVPTVSGCFSQEVVAGLVATLFRPRSRGDSAPRLGSCFDSPALSDSSGKARRPPEQTHAKSPVTNRYRHSSAILPRPLRVFCHENSFARKAQYAGSSQVHTPGGPFAVRRAVPAASSQRGGLRSEHFSFRRGGQRFSEFPVCWSRCWAEWLSSRAILRRCVGCSARLRLISAVMPASVMDFVRYDRSDEMPCCLRVSED